MHIQVVCAQLHSSLLTCSTSCPLITSTSVRISGQNLVCEASLSNWVWEAWKGCVLRHEICTMMYSLSTTVFQLQLVHRNAPPPSALSSAHRRHRFPCPVYFTGGFVSVRRTLLVSRSTWRRAGGPKLRIPKIGITPLRVCHIYSMVCQPVNSLSDSHFGFRV